MNIPLEPTKPLEGVASTAEAQTLAKTRIYTPRVIPPTRLKHIIAISSVVRPDIGAMQLAAMLIPRGFPGSGMVRGKTNVAKTCTYRATYVGLNQERDERRRWRALDKLAKSMGGVGIDPPLEAT
jgi:hypothetical protein